MGRIVVGVDGSSGAQRALEWAVEEAALRDDTVEALLTWHEPYVGGSFAAPVPFDRDDFERSARAQLDRAVDSVHHQLSAPIERILVCGGPAHALMDAAEGADLLVVGSRGHGGFIGLLLGSVSHQVVSHAPCPAVVVPETTDRSEGSEAATGEGIVVGVDGSSGSLAALEWAVEEAARREVEVTAMMAWHEPYATSEIMVTVVSEESLRDSARAALDEAMASLGDEVASNINREVVRGHPTRALLDAAARADLLVVGSRGHGGFTGLLLGSVSHQVAGHSPCPVVVVPHPPRAG